MTIRHGLISKAGFLLFKQSYDSVPPLRQQSAVASRTAQSGRQIHRNQNAVCASRNVPPDTQYEFEDWYDQLGGDASPLADAIIDRIAHDSYRINITSIDAAHDISMREVYGLDKTLRE